KQILNVMPNFVRDHVSLRKVSRRLEANAEFLKETHVEIDLSVFRTIKRTSCGLCKAACGRHLTGEQHELRFLICATHVPKDFRPCVFGVTQYCRNEILCRFVRGRG